MYTYSITVSIQATDFSAILQKFALDKIINEMEVNIRFAMINTIKYEY